MLAILSLILPGLWNFASGSISGLFVYLTNKTSSQATTDKAQLDAQVATNQVKAYWLATLGPTIVSCMAGEICVIYYGSIVLDSMFHFGWAISKLPPPFDQYFWVILSSFIITTPFVGRAK